jgi:hypothetical protein
MRFSTALRVIIVTIVSLVAPATHAADIDFPSPDTAVNAYSTTTYLDLARHFVPDIAATDSGYAGKKIIPLRHIGGPGYTSGQPEEFGFYDIATATMHADGKERLLVLFDMAQSTRSWRFTMPARRSACSTPPISASTRALLSSTRG